MKKIIIIILSFTVMLGCQLNETNLATNKNEEVKIPTYDEFLAQDVIAQTDGSYLVEGDIEVATLADVQKYYNAMVPTQDSKSSAYIPGGVAGAWDVWNNTDRLNITFCISNSFGTDKDNMIDAMLEAAGAWENYANVEFKYVPSEDVNATPGNANVKFVVIPATATQETNNPSTAASMSFPSYSNRKLTAYDNCYLSTTSQATRVRYLTHELGHALGLMHEHVWTLQPDGTYTQTSENQWPAELITAYDPASIMHYSSTGDGFISRLDVDGIQRMYGNNPARYSVFFEKSTTNEKIVYNADWRVYLRKHGEYWNQGYRVENLNAIVQNGEIKYTAIWRPSTSNEEGIYAWTRTDFINKINDAYARGLKIYAVDTFVLNNADYYAATFRPSTDTETWVLGYTRTDFINKYNQLYNQGYRIYRVNTYVINGTELHTGFFRLSSASEPWVIGWSRSDFISKYNTLVSQGYRIYQVDTYRLNGTELYTAYFRSSSVGWTWVMGYEFDDFERRYEDSVKPAGYRLKIQSIF